MNHPFSCKPLFYALAAIAISCIVYLMTMFEWFDGYAHFFGKTHPHKWHSLFRVCFVVVFAMVNHWVLVPRLYIKKYYLGFFSIVFIGLISLLILPDFVLPPPVFDPHRFDSSPFDGKMPPFPMRTLMFELAHVYLFFFIATFISIATKTRQYIQQIEEKVEQQQVDLQVVTSENVLQKETIEERDIETALTVTVDYSLVRIEFSDIFLIKSMGNYLHFFLKDKKPILVRMTLKEASEKLPSDAFLRVHKSYIVAVIHIEHIRNKMILINEQEIPIGRAYEETLLKIFGK